MSSSPDNIYIDLSVVNSDNLGNGLRSALAFNENRTNPILDNPSNYFLSVVRFSVDTPGVSLPIFIPAILLDGVNQDRDVTAYTITITTPNRTTGLLTNVLTQNVRYAPEDQTATAPNNKTAINPATGLSYLTTQDITTGYYNVYSVKWWLSCINKTIANLWALSATPNSPIPTLVIDSGSNLISLITPYPTTTPCNFAFSDDSVNGIGPAPGYVQSPIYLGEYSTLPVNYNLFFNEPMYNLLCGLTSVYYGNTLTNANFDATAQSVVAGRFFLFNYLIVPIYFNGKNVIVLSNPAVTWINSTSEYSSVPMWNPIQSIAFNSALLPVLTNNSSPPNVINSNQFDTTYTSKGQNAQRDNSISDIQIGLVTGSEYKPNILYVPAAQYRLIDMLGTNPIYQVSFSITFKTKFGQILPFRLSSQCGANLKILFVRKRMYLGNLAPYDTN
jgi:hypothetical protein